MACRAYQKPLDILPRISSLRRGARDLGDHHHATFPASIARRSGRVSPPINATPARRALHTSPALRQEGSKPALGGLRNVLASSAQTYLIFGASEKIYKTCSTQAAYSITEQDRKDGKITLGPDGEDVGVGGGGVWHNEFGLLPTFSTWSQVTMLHLYLLIVRLRCLEKDVYRNWQAQLVDHFFHEAEEKMDLMHGMTSRAIRQRNLQDLFQQWRGLILAYDEGIAKGDAVLASAVWRNLFKAKEDVDLRHLAAIVSWMRLCLKNLDKMADDALPLYAAVVFKVPPTAELAVVDRRTAPLQGIYSGTVVQETDQALDDTDKDLPAVLSKPLEDLPKS